MTDRLSINFLFSAAKTKTLKLIHSSWLQERAKHAPHMPAHKHAHDTHRTLFQNAVGFNLFSASVCVELKGLKTWQLNGLNYRWGYTQTQHTHPTHTHARVCVYTHTHTHTHHTHTHRERENNWHCRTHWWNFWHRQVLSLALVLLWTIVHCRENDWHCHTHWWNFWHRYYL